VHEWRDRDPDFAEAWTEALREAVATLEREAWRRAVEGNEEPMVSGGKVVGTVRRYSDSLLALLLRRHAPEYSATGAAAVFHATINGPAAFTFQFEGQRPESAPAAEAPPVIEAAEEG